MTDPFALHVPPDTTPLHFLVNQLRSDEYTHIRAGPTHGAGFLAQKSDARHILLLRDFFFSFLV